MPVDDPRKYALDPVQAMISLLEESVDIYEERQERDCTIPKWLETALHHHGLADIIAKLMAGDRYRWAIETILERRGAAA